MKAWRFLKPALVLCLICAVVAGALALAHGATRAKLAQENTPERTIERNRERYAAALPGCDGFAFLSREEPESGVGVCDVLEGYAAGEPVGWVYVVKAKGYASDPMTLAVGITAGGEVAGVEVMASGETPGVGDRTETEEFLGQFRGGGPFALGEDADAVTGATYSSRGIAQGVNEALAAWKEGLGR